jgi:hypothetical protein
MPVVVVCGVCGRSEVDLRVIELAFRGYAPGEKHTTRSMRRIAAGSTDLCEPCLMRMLGGRGRTFKEVDRLLQYPKRRNRSTPFGGKLDNAGKVAETPK